MNRKSRQKGFSLTEVMMAAGILAIGFMLVAGSFPVAIKLTAEKTEGSISAVVANEAFAKIKLYDPDTIKLYNDQQRPFSRFVISDALLNYLQITEGLSDLHIERLLLAESCYPSTDSAIDDVLVTGAWDDNLGQGYSWSALLRKISPAAYQATVFVVRLTEGNSQYKYYIPAQLPSNAAIASDTQNFPSPVPLIRLDQGLLPGQMVTEIQINTADPDNAQLVNSGQINCLSEKANLIDDLTGKIIKAKAKNYGPGTTLYLELTEPVEEDSLSERLWFVPAEQNSNRYPCVGVYQRTITF